MTHSRRPLRLRLPLLALILFSSFAHTAVAQPIQQLVRGTVRLRGQSVPDQRVEVTLLTSDGRPRDRVFTDSLGNFQFLGLGPGNYILVIEHPGYNRLEERVEVTGGLNRTLTQRAFMLEPKTVAKIELPGTISAEHARMPREARDAYEKGERELAHRNFAKAAEFFAKAAAIAPEYTAAHYQLGVLALQQNEPAKARASFAIAVAGNEQNGDAWIGLGTALSRQGNAQEALEPLNKGLALVAKSYMGYFERCRAHLNLGQLEEALADCESARQNAGGTRPELLVLQGNLYLRLQRNPEALREFQNYLKHDSTSPTADAVRAMIDKMKKAGIKAAA